MFLYTVTQRLREFGPALSKPLLAERTINTDFAEEHVVWTKHLFKVQMVPLLILSSLEISDK